jgi:enoyl-CoA hydratase/carnithine racemase
MLLTGSAISARRAFEEGFLNRLVAREAIEEETGQVLEEIGKGTDLALRGTRRLLNLLDESESLPPGILDEVASIRHEAYRSPASQRAREEYGKKKR